MRSSHARRFVPGVERAPATGRRARTSPASDPRPPRASRRAAGRRGRPARDSASASSSNRTRSRACSARRRSLSPGPPHSRARPYQQLSYRPENVWRPASIPVTVRAAVGSGARTRREEEHGGVRPDHERRQAPGRRGTSGGNVIVEHGHLRKSRHAVPSTFLDVHDDERVVRTTLSKQVIEESPKLDDDGRRRGEIAAYYGSPTRLPADEDGGSTPASRPPRRSARRSCGTWRAARLYGAPGRRSSRPTHTSEPAAKR